jgi:hypothetical protein
VTAPAVVVVACSLDDLRSLVRGEVQAALATHAPAISTTPLLDKRALAHALTISIATVTRMTAEGMPHVFAGASPRYSLDEVRAWLAERGRLGTRAAPSKLGARETIPGVRLLGRASR